VSYRREDEQEEGEEEEEERGSTRGTRMAERVEAHAGGRSIEKRDTSYAPAGGITGNIGKRGTSSAPAGATGLSH